MELREESAGYKSLYEEKVEQKQTWISEKSALERKISELKKNLSEIGNQKLDFEGKYEMLLEQRVDLYTKIKQLEDLNYKRGQTEQTLNLLTNNPTDTRFYNPRKGLGFSVNSTLKNAPPSLYDFSELSDARFTIPTIQEIFVKSESVSISDDKGKKDINDDVSEINFKNVGFQYDELNSSYKDRKPTFSNTDGEFISHNETKISQISEPSSSESSKIETEVLESKSENLSDFVNNMSEDIFDQMMNSSDSDSETEVNLDSEIVISLKNRITELENDLRTEKEFIENERDQFLSKIKELEDEISVLTVNLVCQKTLNNSNNSKCDLVESKFELGESSGTKSDDTCSKTSSKSINSLVKLPIDSNFLSFSEKKRLVWRRKGSEQKETKSTNSSTSVKKSDVKSSCKKTIDHTFVAEHCTLNVHSNKTINVDHSNLLSLAQKNIHCNYCGHQSFSFNTKCSKKCKAKQISQKTSFTWIPKYKSEKHVADKKTKFSKKNESYFVDVRFVWKWVPKTKYEWRVKEISTNLLETNKSGPVWKWVPKSM